MYLIMGLGNPDKQYLKTYHNVGFMCADLIAEKLGTTFSKGECRAVTAYSGIGSDKIIIAKPITYMNLSGESARELINKYKIERECFVVIYDDIDLPVGNVRIRYTGSAGTHNGMKNIVRNVGSTDVYRIRIGVGKPENAGMDLKDFVLSKISDEVMDSLAPALDRAADAAIAFAKGLPIEKVMEKYNKRDTAASALKNGAKNPDNNA